MLRNVRVSELVIAIMAAKLFAPGLSRCERGRSVEMDILGRWRFDGCGSGHLARGFHQCRPRIYSRLEVLKSLSALLPQWPNVVLYRCPDLGDVDAVVFVAQPVPEPLDGLPRETRQQVL